MRIYQRNLPHFHIPERDYTLVYTLAGSLPSKAIDQLTDSFITKKLAVDILPGTELTIKDKRRLQQLENDYAARFDQYLHQVKNGPTYLQQPEIAQIIIDSIYFVENVLRYWTVWSYCIMPNHVHLECSLKENAPSLELIMKSHKNFTALESNRVLKREGAFWRHETFDRLIRNEEDFTRRVWYTIMNPVVAGLIKRWQDWPFTYIHPIIRPEFILANSY